MSNAGLMVRFQGDVKAGKTKTAVWYALQFYKKGLPVYTNMYQAKYKGIPWAQTVKIDELIKDLTKSEAEAEFKNGVLLLDEFHTYMDPSAGGGILQAMLTRLLVQCGKRGLPVLYTTHLSGMVPPRVRELTTINVYCDTPDQGRTQFLNVTDLSAQRKAFHLNQPPPDESWLVLHNASVLNPWYDTNEPIDPMAAMRSVAASARGRKILRALDGTHDEIDQSKSDLRAEAGELRNQIRMQQVMNGEALPIRGRSGR